MMKRVIGYLLVALIGVVLHTTEAAAEFRICNSTGSSLDTAMGYLDIDGNWGSHGWWVIAPGECKTTIGGALTNRYYYVWAETSLSHDLEWSGDTPFCVEIGKAFQIHTRDCGPHNYPSKNFRRVDVGSANSYTFNATLARPTSVTSNDTYRSEVDTAFSRIRTLMEERGWASTTTVFRGALRTDTRDVQSMSLEAGVTYVFVGQCDRDCHDLDLVLRDEYGNVVARDTQADDHPMLEVHVARTGTFRLDALMASCGNGPCRYGVAVFMSDRRYRTN